MIVTSPSAGQDVLVYFTDRGIDELDARRGEEQVTLSWVAERLRTFTDAHPEFEVAVERLATWLARTDDEIDEVIDEMPERG